MSDEQESDSVAERDTKRVSRSDPPLPHSATVEGGIHSRPQPMLSLHRRSLGSIFVMGKKATLSPFVTRNA
jgi:hypothetical protein